MTTVDVTVPLSASDAEEKASASVRDVTGITLADGSGSKALSTFSTLVVDVDVDAKPSGRESRIHISLRAVPRNTGLALLTLVLLVLSIVGILIYVLRPPGKRGDRSTLKAIADKLEAAILSSR